MKNRLATALAVTALIVALMGATGVAQAVVVGFAANAGKLAGFKPSKTKKKNTVVVRGKNGLIDAASIPPQARGARGAQGIQGPPGPAGAQGIQGIQGIPGPPGAPNPNADTVNGYAATELNRQVNLAFPTFQTLPASNSQFVQVQITAPKRGYLHSTASFYTYYSAGAGFPCVEKWWQTLDTTNPNALIDESFVATNALASGLKVDNQTSQTTVVVNPGVHTLRLIYTEESGGCRAAGTFGFGRGGWSVRFVPFNGSGFVPAGIQAHGNKANTATTQ